jgi:hypothetical protein
MIQYRHSLRFIEGNIENGNFEDVATLRYEGLLPSAPSKGLVISLNDWIEFEMSSLQYLQTEEIYESFSHIDFLEMESRFNDYVPRADWIARYVKYGFTVLYTDTVTKKEIESAVKSVVI